MLRFFNKYFFLPILDFFIPNKCISCSNNLSDNEFYLCDNCFEDLNFHKNVNQKTFSLFSYRDNLKFLVMKLKYEDNPKVGVILGEKLALKLKEFNLLDFKSREKYFLIPVPLHKKRKKTRKYNQAFHIAKGIENILKFPVVDNLVVRTKDNISQTQLNNDVERKKNVKDIFKLIKHGNNIEVIKEKIAIIVDDIITTGSTIKEVNDVLIKNGFKNSFGISVAAPEKKIENYDD